MRSTCSSLPLLSSIQLTRVLSSFRTEKTAQANSNKRIVHTEEVRLLREVMGVEQALEQKTVGMVEEVYLAGIRNRTTKSINNIMAGVLTHTQDNYSQFMPHNILKREVIVKKLIYNSHDPIATVFSIVKEFLLFADITATSYTQLQEVNITHVIIHRTGKFRLAICEWNCMP